MGRGYGVSSGGSELSGAVVFLEFPLVITIMFVRAGLTSIVVGNHLLMGRKRFPVRSLFHRVVAGRLTHVTIPLFFFVSKFLFFCRASFSVGVCGRGLGGHIEALLIPCLF